MEKIKDYDILYDDIWSNYLDEDGNVDEIYISQKASIMSTDGKKNLSKPYYYIEELWDDHFIVCDLVITEPGFGIETRDVLSTTKVGFKYGVIRVKRNKKKEIIPMQETVVIAPVYDKISGANSNVIIAYGNNNHLTYVDLDVKSPNYAEQLVPVVLNHAVPFDTEYEGFAECSIGNVVGYLPRNCKPRTKLNGKDLLTKDQVEYLLKYFPRAFMHDQSVRAFEKLTGTKKTLSYK